MSALCLQRPLNEPNRRMRQFLVGSNRSENIRGLQRCRGTGAENVLWLIIEKEKRTTEPSNLPEDRATSLRAINKLSPSTYENERFKHPETSVEVYYTIIALIIGGNAHFGL